MYSQKHRIYCELMTRGMIDLKSLAAHLSLHDQSSISAIIELMHNLPRAMLLENDTIGSEDIWFINHQSKVFCDKISSINTLYRDQYLQLIDELIRLVPPGLVSQLNWNGPLS